MTELEKYIAKNKDRLEPREVNPKIWLAIENEILKTRDRRRSLYVKIASAAAIVLVAAFFIGDQLINDSTSFEEKLIEMYGYESYQFVQEVSLKKSALSNAKIPSKHMADFQELIQQLEFLDKQYLDYLNYAEQNGYESFIGDQILNYYQSKIDLLDLIQQEIKKVNYYENKFPNNDTQVVLSL